MAGVVHIPWYATVFRGDKFEAALELIAPLAIRYGATDYRVYRNRDDRYKFLQMATFEDKLDFERYWYGEDFSDWRRDYSSWYQVPIVYSWNDMVFQGEPRARRQRRHASSRAGAGGSYDEVFAPSGDPRPHTEALAGALSELGPRGAGRRRPPPRRDLHAAGDHVRRRRARTSTGRSATGRSRWTSSRG